MDLSSPAMQEIMAAGAVFLGGDRARGRALLLALWDKHAANRDPLQICAMAHNLADSEADPARALDWDLHALEAATGSRDAEDRDAISPVPETFLPSLHLNVADCYRRLGDLERARCHAAFAARREQVLPDDGYGKMIRAGIQRLQTALAG